MCAYHLNTRKLVLLVLAQLFLVALLGCSVAQGKENPVIGDAPAIRDHTDQADIDSRRLKLRDLIRRGELLMTASFNTLDGAGRPETSGTGDPRMRRDPPQNFNRISSPDANACSGCHILPRAGGGGDNVANVFVLAQRLNFVNFDGGEGDNFQIHTLQNVGNERNTLGMFGSGFIELLAREMTADLHNIRDAAIQEARSSNQSVTRDLVTKGVSFGTITSLPNGALDTSKVEGVDVDLIIKPFHQKGAVISLREFTNNAFNHHHGMQSSERVGDGADPDKDGVADELTRGDLTAITIFQATLPVPGRVQPAQKEAREAAERGERLFSETGCAVCHMPALRLDNPVFTEPNPYNPPGNLQLADVPHPFAVDLTKESPRPRLRREKDGSVLVPAFTDLKRHRMGEALNNEKLVQAGIPTDQWLTRKLWGMASEPPFLHHGRALLISEAILTHGGEAQEARDAFAALPEEDRAAIVEFLKTLQILPEGTKRLHIKGDRDDRRDRD